MPTLDEAADRVVDESERLQSILRGEEFLLFPPGGAATLAVNLTLLVAWGALASPVMARSIDPDHPSKSALILATYVVGGVLVTLIPGFLVVQGCSSASRISRGTARILLGLCSVAFFVSCAEGDLIGMSARAIGLALLVVAERLSSGRKFALAAAFFRARRRREIEMRRRRDAVLNGRD